MDDIEFLTFEDICEIHSDQLARYGGQDGILDRGKVEAALAQPQATMFGDFLHKDIAEMAAAYFFHFAASQGFIDGNKRTAAASAGVFLFRNGYELTCTNEELYDMAMRIANKQVERPEIANWLRSHLAPRR